MKLFSNACKRNQNPILDVLREVLPKTGTVLEIASGTGMHVVHFAKALPGLNFQPTDQDVDALASIAAWREEAGLTNILAPLSLNVLSETWPIEAAAAIINANMIHISPWECTQGLMAGAGRTLPKGGILSLYGPFMVDGVKTAPSNLQFDLSLKNRDPQWGIRKLGDVRRLAEAEGFILLRTIEMPANNMVLIFKREGPVNDTTH